MINNKILIELLPTDNQKKIINNYINLGKHTFTQFLNTALNFKEIQTFNSITNENILNKVKELNPNIKKEQLYIINEEFEQVKLCINKSLQGKDTIDNFSKKHTNQNSYTILNKHKAIKLYDNSVELPILGNINTDTISNIYQNQKLILARILKIQNNYKIELIFKRYYTMNEILYILEKKKPNFIATYSKIKTTSTFQNINSLEENEKYKHLLKLKSLENILNKKEKYSKSWFTILNRIHKVATKIIFSKHLYN